MATIIFDPLKRYPHLSQEQIVDACGLVLEWVASYLGLLESLGEREGLAVYLQAMYRFPAPHTPDVEITEEGLFRYPGDPDLAPLVHVEHNGETFYQYPHAFIAVVKEGAPCFVTRMD